MITDKPKKQYNPATHNPPRLCGWSAQGDPRQDSEASRIHHDWIRRSPKGK